MTIFLDLKGCCRVLGNQFEFVVNDEIFVLHQHQTEFAITKKLNVTQGWNKIEIVHNDHPNDLTILKGEKIADISFVSFDQILLDGFFVSHNMWKNSGGKAFNPNSNKQLHLHTLGEPFQLQINFYYPFEYWTFALAESNTNYGRIGWQ